jgi:hypothetical protein
MIPKAKANENKTNLPANNCGEKFLMSCCTNLVSPIFFIVLFFHLNKKTKSIAKTTSAENSNKNSLY